MELGSISKEVNDNDNALGSRPLEVRSFSIEDVKFGPDGLIPAIVQDCETLSVLTLAYMDEEALRRTIESGRTWFWSRSRREYWNKGETSGARQYVRKVCLDCDADALLIQVDQHGVGACHTGQWSCFFKEIAEGPGYPRTNSGIGDDDQDQGVAIRSDT